MPAYGTPSALYGNANYPYGRLSPEIVAILNSKHRETGLRVTIQDMNYNSWVKFTGSEFDPYIYSNGGDQNITHQAYWGYRGKAVLIPKKTGTGFMRYRIGDGTFADRNIYSQDISDPTQASQWTSWTLLYSGTHYALSAGYSGTSIIVYTAKSDGVYRNNVKISNLTGVADLRNNLDRTTEELWAIQVVEDPIDGAGKYRDFNAWYTSAANSLVPGTPDAGSEFYQVLFNYRWYRLGVCPYLDPASGNGSVIITAPYYTDPRSRNTGDTIVALPNLQTQTPGGLYCETPYPVRGLASPGHNTISGAIITKIGTEYYLFYNEWHSNNNYESLVTPGTSVVWQRSKDGIHWGEPVFTGFSCAIAGVAAYGDYVYFAGWGSVYRRWGVEADYDISNYIPQLSLEIPRDNQTGTGKFVCSNPAGVNDSMIGMTDKPVKVELGIKNASGIYEFYECDKWWIKSATRIVDKSENRIEFNIHDLWGRLDNPLRDTFNFIGQTVWNDFLPTEGQNKVFPYYFVSDAGPTVNADNQLVSKSIVLWTGWKGHNGTVRASFTADTHKEGLVFRYIDTTHYFKVYFSAAGTLSLVMVNGANATVLGTGSCSSRRFEVRFHGRSVQVTDPWNGNASIFSVLLTASQILAKPGYCGMIGDTFTAAGFRFHDHEAPLTTKDLVATALAMGEFFDVQYNAEDVISRQMSIQWGPQTDLPTIAEALARSLEIDKLQLVWRDGYIRVGKFKDPSIISTLRDEIIDTQYSDDAARRINLALVDGNENSWLEVDSVDAGNRDRQINSYFDVPELLDQDAVTARAQEEIARGKLGRSPGGTIVYQPSLWRLDAITWIDNAGNSTDVRIEGFEFEVDQSKEPHQHQRVDTSLLNA